MAQHIASEYVEIEVPWSSNIEFAVNMLLNAKSQGYLAKCKFNDTWLYSDTVTLDSAYKEITGLTYQEFKKKEEQRHKELEKQLQEEKDHAIARIPEWIERGHKLLPDFKWKEWDEVVPIRASDMYHGMELDGMLDIQEILLEDQPDSFERAHKCLEGQGHSGASFGLMCSLFQEFCYHGCEFTNYILG